MTLAAFFNYGIVIEDRWLPPFYGMTILTDFIGLEVFVMFAASNHIVMTTGTACCRNVMVKFSQFPRLGIVTIITGLAASDMGI